MTDEVSFLKAIYDDPNDMAPRLVYADWLDEQGKHQRADWIRKRIGSPSVMECSYMALKDTVFYERNGFQELIYTSPGAWENNADRWTESYPINQVVFLEIPNLRYLSGNFAIKEGFFSKIARLEAEILVGQRSVKWWEEKPITITNESSPHYRGLRTHLLACCRSTWPYEQIWPEISFHSIVQTVNSDGPMGNRIDHHLYPATDRPIGDLLKMHLIRGRLVC